MRLPADPLPELTTVEEVLHHVCEAAQVPDQAHEELHHTPTSGQWSRSTAVDG